MSILIKLNSLIDVEIECWHTKGIKLRAASFSANGLVNSGILKDGTYFYKKWDFCKESYTWSNPRYVVGE